MLYRIINAIHAKVNIFLDELVDQIDDVASTISGHDDSDDDTYDVESNIYTQNIALVSISKND